MALLCKYVPPTLEEYDWDPKTQDAYFTHALPVVGLVSTTAPQPLAKHVATDYDALKAKYYADLALWIGAEHGR